MTDLLVESELLLMAVTMVRLLALLPGEAGTWWRYNSKLHCLQVEPGRRGRGVVYQGNSGCPYRGAGGHEGVGGH